MAKVTEEQVLEALKNVIDPEVGLDIVNLGLIYDVRVSDDDIVHTKMTMTIPGCPLQNQILFAAEQVILGIPGVKDAIVELVWEPPWNPNMMSDEAKKRLGY